jgi:hypothetical protein
MGNEWIPCLEPDGHRNVGVGEFNLGQRVGSVKDRFAEAGETCVRPCAGSAFIRWLKDAFEDSGHWGLCFLLHPQREE